MDDEKDNLMPQGQSLFPLTADDIVDNALQSLDEQQAKEVSKKAADEVVKIAVEKRKAEYRSDRAQEEMRNLIHNANLLAEQVSDYKINSTFETATGTTSVEIKKSKTNFILILIGIGAFLAIILLFLLLR
jgi:hypothetical protein